MSIYRSLFYLILVNIIIASPQINLHLTGLINNQENSKHLQHDCLYVSAPLDKENDRYQTISYCMSEWPSEWYIETNDVYQKLTFAELSKLNITSEELYIWSAPIDIVENYEYYLNLNKTLLENEIYYNCTLPRFGLKCEYEFEYYKFNYKSFDEMINNYYYEHQYEPKTLTCYIHLQCNNDINSICLDWSDICDGKIDCFHNGFDEKYCWQLEINECDPDEFRCKNGQCIPYIFFLDNDIVHDCIDGSDEKQIRNFYDKCQKSQPTFQCEDITCPSIYRRYRLPFTSSCVFQRNYLFEKALFSNIPTSLSESCWLAFKCLIHMPILRDPTCQNLCENGACEIMIQNNCPDMLFVPSIPILFGHVYFAYTKSESKYSRIFPLGPQYICYNEQLCGDLMINATFIRFNNFICVRRSDFPIHFINSGRSSWTETFVSPTYRFFQTCNSIIDNNIIYCNRSTMYQCLKSPKCVSIYRLKDGTQDCYYGDDEDSLIINTINSSELLQRYFKCTTTNEYISHILVGNNYCDCSLYNDILCDDEELEIRYEKTHILFQTICDGFNELYPIIIDNKTETDETECEYWLCNNTYTRCNGLWNCFNGADEINCDLSLIKCPLYHHICVSPITNQLTCLPIENANDYHIDCLGGTDEPSLCRLDDYKTVQGNFYCENDGFSSCINSYFLCDGFNECLSGEDEQMCHTKGNSICNDEYILNRSIVEQYLCNRLYNSQKQPIVYFTLNDIDNDSINTRTIQQKSYLSNINTYEQRCHRGLELKIWLNNKKNQIICLCPPSFYGNKCQYQNERISLTIKFESLSISWQTLFSIIIFLIDNTTEQLIINSYEQFSYLPMRDCQKKFNIYLLYSTRPKYFNKTYLIHIDIYETVSLSYRASFLIPLKFTFLPVYRLAIQLNIPSNNNSLDNCLDNQCIHGKCLRYIGKNNQTTFCQCEEGWSGKFCTIQYNCQCSSNSLCIGISNNNNRSICICPMNKFGSRCLLNKSLCQYKGNISCLNNGQCIPDERNFTCICPEGFSGDRCEIMDTKIIIKFTNDIILSQSILVHFIEVINNSLPKRITTFNTLSFVEKTSIIYWSYPFHIIFIESSNKTYYLTIIQRMYKQSQIINKTIEISDRCEHINEIFNETIVNLHLLRRIKYYHLSCQKYNSSLKCFYDEIHFCLCENFGKQRQANCFEFNHQMKFDCSGQSSCENNAQCFQDNPICPKKSICICPICYYGRQCQFNTIGFGLFLDAIIGYQIIPQVSLINQPFIIKMSLALTIIIGLIGFINGILSIMTFKNKKLLEVGCGLYLLASSITTLLITIMFILKFSILLGTQITLLNNRIFLYIQCLLIDFLLRIFLTIDQWLNAFVAVERAYTSIKGTRFNRNKSKNISKYTIFILLFLTIITNIHDPIHRDLLNDDDNYNDKRRIWCIVKYSSNIQIYNSFINIFHFSIPFLFNLISALIIIKTKAKLRARIHSDQTYNQILNNQFQQYRHLIITPLLLIILSIPRVILTLISGCMTSIQDSWLFLIGYFISFIPSMSIFLVFIIPSKLYKDQLRRSIGRYQRRIQNIITSF